MKEIIPVVATITVVGGGLLLFKKVDPVKAVTDTVSNVVDRATENIGNFSDGFDERRRSANSELFDAIGSKVYAPLVDVAGNAVDFMRTQAMAPVNTLTNVALRAFRR